MGTISHDALIVMGWDFDDVEAARLAAVELAQNVETPAGITEDFSRLISPTIHSVMNAYCSFYVAPDGSKEWWDTSDRGDELRAAILERFESDHKNVSVIQVRWGELGVRLDANGRTISAE